MRGHALMHKQDIVLYRNAILISLRFLPDDPGEAEEISS